MKTVVSGHAKECKSNQASDKWTLAKYWYVQASLKPKEEGEEMQ